KKMADNITKNNALLNRLSAKDKIRTIDGGSKILEELEYGQGDVVWYSGFDTISYTGPELFSAAEYALKLCAVPVAISGEDMLKNSGREQMISLFEKRIQNAEKTIANSIGVALYSDGTGSSGKEIGGLKLLIADAPTSGTVGGINRATSGNEFWRNKANVISASANALTSSTILSKMNDMYLKCSRGTDKPDLIVTDDYLYDMYETALQPMQRFCDPKLAEAGFQCLKYKGADVIFDGGQGGSCPSKHMYFINTNYLYLRPHKDRNFKVIGGERMAINSDAIYKIIGWAGNLTMSNAALQGVLVDYIAPAVSN
ncbi:MAG: phage major capsid protein, partial [Alphaproteobacteria bacterium]|nr:phage major capsid protein [Alphaproteobacteria bacterium]